MDILLKRENAFSLFRNINSAILNHYVQLKNQFRDNSPSTEQIIVRLKTWKEPLEETINHQITKVLKCSQMPSELSQIFVLSTIIENYKQQQEFIELYKNLTSSIETIKDFIKTNAFRDTSKEVITT